MDKEDFEGIKRGLEEALDYVKGMKGKCGCYTCTKERFYEELDKGNTPAWFNNPASIMFLCPTCSNKRCPRATNHIHDCTGSNEPGQKGSNYE